MAVSDKELEEAVADHILYVIVLPSKDAGEYSPFQGFSLNSFPVTNIIQYVCRLPATISELFRNRDEAIRFRSIGLSGYAIVLIELEFLDQFKVGPPLTCFISNPENLHTVESYIAGKGRRGWLHLTVDESSSSVPKLWDFSRAEIYKWIRRVAEAEVLENSPRHSAFREFVPWPEETAKAKTRFHNITLPTETALRSFNFVLPGDGKPLSGNSDDEFAEAIDMGANELQRVRRDAEADHHITPGSPTLILTVPSVFRHLAPNQLAREATRPVRKVIRNILRQRQYIALRESGEDTIEMLKDPLAAALLKIRAEELTTYTAALSVAASSFGIPVLRCPPQVDRVRELLIRLAGMSRAKIQNSERRNKLAKTIGESLRTAIPNIILRRIEKHRSDGIKFIGDTPLELIPIDGLPLGLRATTSRMPTLPGNLLMRHGLLRTPLFIRPKDLTKILVVRSFDRGDRLRPLLVQAIGFMNSKSKNKIEIQVADVATREEFVAAFNNFDGLLAIFDGHGAQDRTDPQGTIRLGSVHINPFELYGQIKLPPILLLSACETHTLEGIESSVASAFLMMGARSILGTIVPIDGRKAAILIARFILRFSEFVPLLRTMIPWPQIVSGMLRMSYVTDVLMEFDKTFGLGEEKYKKIHTDANIAINSFHPEWFEEMLSSLASEVSISDTQAREAWMRTCYFTDTLHYVHLGQPEHIFVIPN